MDRKEAKKKYDEIQKGKFDEPKLNYNQRRAIELEQKGKLPELAEQLKEEGRQKQSKKIVEEILSEENITNSLLSFVEKE